MTKNPPLKSFPLERRKVPGREWKISIRIVELLISAGISANTASIIGMFFGILSGLFFYLTNYNPLFYIAGAVSIFIRSAFNIFDGMIAHKTGNMTAKGTFLNDFTDRIADVFMIVGYGYALKSSPVWGMLACIGALLTASVRLAGKVAGAKMYYGGIMSKPIRMYALIFSVPLVFILWDYPIPVYTLIVITLGSFITVLQRTWWILREI